MKKIVFLATFLLLCLTQAWAYDFCCTISGNTIYFNILSGNTAEVTYPGTSVVNPYTNFSKPTGTIILPGYVSYAGTTYTITAIGTYAFAYCDGLTYLSIPSTVTSIGMDACYKCKRLTGVSLPNSLTTIDYYAFAYCTSMLSVTIPSSVTTIRSGAFLYVRTIVDNSYASGAPWGANSTNGYVQYPFVYSNSSKTKLVGCASSVTMVNNGNSPSIPSSVTEIGADAFAFCDTLNYVYLPNDIATIGAHAFSNCGNLRTIHMPHNLTSCGLHAFMYCDSLTRVYYDEPIEDWFRITFASQQANPIYYVKSLYSSNYWNEGVTYYVVPSDVTRISPNAFINDTSITYLEIGSQVTTIGQDAFHNCPNLKEVNDISNSSVQINSGAFGYCTGLVSVDVPANASVSYDAFYKVRNVNTSSTSNNAPWGAYSLNGYVEYQGEVVFSNSSMASLVACSGNATAITIPATVTSLGAKAFSDCSKLTKIIAHPTTVSAQNSSFNSVPATAAIYVPYNKISAYRNAWTRFSNFIAIRDVYPIKPDYSFFDDFEGYSSVTEMGWEPKWNYPSDYHWGLQDFHSSVYARNDVKAYRGKQSLTGSGGILATPEGTYMHLLSPKFHIDTKTGKYDSVIVDFWYYRGEDSLTVKLWMDGASSFFWHTPIVGSRYEWARYRKAYPAKYFANDTTFRVCLRSDVENDSDEIGVYVDDFSVSYKPMINVTTKALPSNGGSVTSVGLVEANTTVTFTATPNAGYEFDHWVRTNDQSQTYVATGTAHKSVELESDNSDVTYTAVFIPILHDTIHITNEVCPSVTINASANSSEYGSVSGNGTYKRGADVELLAMPKPGYHFDHWGRRIGVGMYVPYSSSNPLILTDRKSDMTLSAVFVAD